MTTETARSDSVAVTGRSVRWLLAGAFAVALALFALAGIASDQAARQAQANLAWVEHSLRVQTELAGLERAVLEMETAHRGLLVTGAERELRARDQATGEAQRTLTRLRALVVDNPVQEARLAQVGAALEQRIARMARATDVATHDGIDAARARFAPAGAGTLVPLQVAIDAVRATEGQLRAERLQRANRQAGRLRQTTFWAPALGAFVLVVGLGVVYRLWRRGERLLLRVDAEREQAQRALELVDATADAVLVYRADSLQIEYANVAAAAQLGTSRESIQGRSILDFKSEFDAATLRARLAPLLANPGQVIRLETVHRRDDGHRVPVEISLRCVAPTGQAPRLVSVARDLTERRQAEEERQRFFQLSLDMLCVANATGHFEHVSPAFTVTLGWSVEELTSRPFLEFVHPDDHEATLREVERQVQEGRPVLNFENRYRHKDGGWRVLSWRSQPGPEGRMFATARDVTERNTAEAKLRESEARLRTVIDASYDAFVIMDSDGNVREWSRRAEETFGWAAAEAVGRPVAEMIVPPEQRDAHRFGLARYLGTGESRMLGRTVEVMARHRDGRDFPVEITVSPIRTEGAVIFSAFLRDISERRHNEARIAALNRGLAERSQALEAANKELEAFSYSVSHDLRAPLRHVAGYARMLVEDNAGKLDPGSRRYLEAISASARRMGQLIDDLLALARLGRKPVDARRLDMDDLVGGVVAELAPAAGTLVVDALPDAAGDPVLLRQAWLNLLSNAIKYSAPRGADARIEVSGERLPEAVRYRVRDNGVGFDMRYADKLFGVFQRMHSADEFEGTGVGLAIVQRILSRHGGTIRAEAEPGRGATFTFELPAAEVSP